MVSLGEEGAILSVEGRLLSVRRSLEIEQDG